MRLEELVSSGFDRLEAALATTASALALAPVEEGQKVKKKGGGVGRGGGSEKREGLRSAALGKRKRPEEDSGDEEGRPLFVPYGQEEGEEEEESEDELASFIAEAAKVLEPAA